MLNKIDNSVPMDWRNPIPIELDLRYSSLYARLTDAQAKLERIGKIQLSTELMEKCCLIKSEAPGPEQGK